MSSFANYSTNLYIIEKLIESQNIMVREQSLEELGRQGVEVKRNFNFDIYLCKVCDECFQTIDTALDHTRSIEHFDQKSGKFANELDRALVVATERLLDINIVLARKQELNKLDLKTKYEFLRHGIRIKDGVGTDAFICMECKESFLSFNYVRHHLSKFKTYTHESEAVYSSNTFQAPVNGNYGLMPSSSSLSVWPQNSGQPSSSGLQHQSQNRSNSIELSGDLSRRTEKRKLNANSNPESELESNQRKRKRKRNRNRNRNRDRRPHSNQANNKSD